MRHHAAKPVLLALVLTATATIAPATAGRVIADNDLFHVEITENETPFLGVSSGSTRDDGGAKIVRVVPGSAAAEAGIRRGDVIVAFDGQPVRGPRDLTKRIHSREPGDAVTVTVLRDDVESDLSLALGRRPGQLRFDAKGEWHVWSPHFRGHVKDGTLITTDAEDTDEIYVCPGEHCRFSRDAVWYSLDCVENGCPGYRVDWWGRPMLGVGVVETTRELRHHLGGGDDAGVLVSRVHEGSPAERAGIEVGDLIVAVGGRAVADSGEIRRAIEDKGGAAVDVDVIRDGRPVLLRVDLPRSDVRPR